MATTVTIKYNTATAVTITLASLASSATVGQESASIDNTTNQYVDYLAGGKITVGTTPTINTQIEIWVAGSYDGTTYAGNATGANAALTLTQQNKTLFRLGTIISVTATTSNVTFPFVIGSVANLFGGICPIKFSFFVIHNTVAALNATAANHEIKTQGIQYVST